MSIFDDFFSGPSTGNTIIDAIDSGDFLPSPTWNTVTNPLGNLSAKGKFGAPLGDINFNPFLQSGSPTSVSQADGDMGPPPFDVMQFVQSTLDATVPRWVRSPDKPSAPSTYNAKTITTEKSPTDSASMLGGKSTTFILIALMLVGFLFLRGK